MIIYPFTMREAPERFVVIAMGEPTPYHLPRSARETAACVDVLRDALDQNKNAVITVSPADPRQIVSAALDRPDERAKPRCLDRPEMTREFWSAQEAVPDLPSDHVRWVARVPGCASHRVAFVRAAAFSWIHPEHPRAQAMLAVAWRSINEDRPVQTSVCGTARAFLADLRLG